MVSLQCNLWNLSFDRFKCRFWQLLPKKVFGPSIPNYPQIDPGNMYFGLLWKPNNAFTMSGTGMRHPWIGWCIHSGAFSKRCIRGRSWPDPDVPRAPEGCSVKTKQRCNLLSMLAHDAWKTCKHPVFGCAVANTFEWLEFRISDIATHICRRVWPRHIYKLQRVECNASESNVASDYFKVKCKSMQAPLKTEFKTARRGLTTPHSQ